MSLLVLEPRPFCLHCRQLTCSTYNFSVSLRRRRRHDAAGPYGGAVRVCVPPWTQPALHGATTSHRVAHPHLDILAIPPQRLSL